MSAIRNSTFEPALGLSISQQFFIHPGQITVGTNMKNYQESSKKGQVWHAVIMQVSEMGKWHCLFGKILMKP